MSNSSARWPSHWTSVAAVVLVAVDHATGKLNVPPGPTGRPEQWQQHALCDCVVSEEEAENNIYPKQQRVLTTVGSVV